MKLRLLSLVFEDGGGVQRGRRPASLVWATCHSVLFSRLSFDLIARHPEGDDGKVGLPPMATSEEDSTLPVFRSREDRLIVCLDYQNSTVAPGLALLPQFEDELSHLDGRCLCMLGKTAVSHSLLLTTSSNGSISSPSAVASATASTSAPAAPSEPSQDFLLVFLFDTETERDALLLSWQQALSRLDARDGADMMRRRMRKEKETEEKLAAAGDSNGFPANNNASASTSASPAASQPQQQPHAPPSSSVSSSSSSFFSSLKPSASKRLRPLVASAAQQPPPPPPPPPPATVPSPEPPVTSGLAASTAATAATTITAQQKAIISTALPASLKAHLRRFRGKPLLLFRRPDHAFTLLVLACRYVDRYRSTVAATGNTTTTSSSSSSSSSSNGGGGVVGTDGVFGQQHAEAAQQQQQQQPALLRARMDSSGDSQSILFATTATTSTAAPSLSSSASRGSNNASASQGLRNRYGGKSQSFAAPSSSSSSLSAQPQGTSTAVIKAKPSSASPGLKRDDVLDIDALLFGDDDDNDDEEEQGVAAGEKKKTSADKGKAKKKKGGSQNKLHGYGSETSTNSEGSGDSFEFVERRYKEGRKQRSITFAEAMRHGEGREDVLPPSLALVNAASAAAAGIGSSLSPAPGSLPTDSIKRARAYSDGAAGTRHALLAGAGGGDAQGGLSASLLATPPPGTPLPHFGVATAATGAAQGQQQHQQPKQQHWMLSDSMVSKAIATQTVRRHHFIAIAGRYFPLLCDQYTAGAVFDTLVEGSQAVKLQDLSLDLDHDNNTDEAGSSSLGSSLAAQVNKEAEKAEEDESEVAVLTLTRKVTWERVLPFPLFERYVIALGRPILRPPSAWTALREALQLDPREIVLKVEMMVEAVVSMRIMVAVDKDALTEVTAACLLAATGVTGKKEKGDAAFATAVSVPALLRQLRRMMTTIPSPAATSSAPDGLPCLPAGTACDLPLPLPSSLIPPASLRHHTHGHHSATAADSKAVATMSGRGKRKRGGASKEELLMARHAAMRFSGRPLRRFIADRDEEREEWRRRELYGDDDAAAAAASSSSSSSDDGEGERGAQGRRRYAAVAAGHPQASSQGLLKRAASFIPSWLGREGSPAAGEAVSNSQDRSSIVARERSFTANLEAAALAEETAQASATEGEESALEDVEEDLREEGEEGEDMGNTSALDEDEEEGEEEEQQENGRGEGDEEGIAGGTGDDAMLDQVLFGADLKGTAKKRNANASRATATVARAGNWLLTRMRSSNKQAGRVGNISAGAGQGAQIEDSSEEDLAEEEQDEEDDDGDGDYDSGFGEPDAEPQSKVKTAKKPPPASSAPSFGPSRADLRAVTAALTSGGSADKPVSQQAISLAAAALHRLTVQGVGELPLHLPTIAALLGTGEVEVRLGGVLLLTDRSIYFQVTSGWKNEVLVLPIAALAKVVRLNPHQQQNQHQQQQQHHHDHDDASHHESDEGSSLVGESVAGGGAGGAGGGGTAVPGDDWATIQSVKTKVKTLGMVSLGQRSDNGLRLPAPELRRLALDSDVEEDGGASESPLNAMFVAGAALRGGVLNCNRLPRWIGTIHQQQRAAVAAASAAIGTSSLSSYGAIFGASSPSLFGNASSSSSSATSAVPAVQIVPSSLPTAKDARVPKHGGGGGGSGSSVYTSVTNASVDSNNSRASSGNNNYSSQGTASRLRNAVSFAFDSGHSNASTSVAPPLDQNAPLFGSGSKGEESPPAAPPLAPTSLSRASPSPSSPFLQPPAASSSLFSPVPASLPAFNQDGAAAMANGPGATMAPFGLLPPLPPPGILVPRVTITFIFSKVKDLLLRERTGGGRREVIRRSIEELVAAQQTSPVLARAMDEALAKARDDCSDQDNDKKKTDLALSATSLHPKLVRVATAGISFSDILAGHPLAQDRMRRQIKSFLGLPMASLKAALKRSRADQQAFGRRLELFASLNVLRSRALLKSTGRVCPSLYINSAFARQGFIGGSVSSIAIDSSPSAVAVRGVMLGDDPAWLLRIAPVISQEKTVLQNRAATLRRFDRRVFTSEMSTLLENFIHPLNTFRQLLIYIHAWESPLLSFCVFSGLLLFALQGLVVFTIPITLLLHAMAVLLYGSMDAQSRALVQALCTRPKPRKGRTLLEKLRAFRDTLANNQVRMRTVNNFALKIRALYTWRDPARTKTFIVFLTVAAIIMAVVPSRILVALFAFLQLTKPLRDPGAGLVTLAFKRFWDNLPVAGPADAVYCSVSEEDPLLGGEAGGAGSSSSLSSIADAAASLHRAHKEQAALFFQDLQLQQQQQLLEGLATDKGKAFETPIKKPQESSAGRKDDDTAPVASTFAGRFATRLPRLARLLRVGQSGPPDGASAAKTGAAGNDSEGRRNKASVEAATAASNSTAPMSPPRPSVASTAAASFLLSPTVVASRAGIVVDGPTSSLSSDPKAFLTTNIFSASSPDAVAALQAWSGSSSAAAALKASGASSSASLKPGRAPLTPFGIAQQPALLRKRERDAAVTAAAAVTLKDGVKIQVLRC